MNRHLRRRHCRGDRRAKRPGTRPERWCCWPGTQPERCCWCLQRRARNATEPRDQRIWTVRIGMLEREALKWWHRTSGCCELRWRNRDYLHGEEVLGRAAVASRRRRLRGQSVEDSRTASQGEPVAAAAVSRHERERRARPRVACWPAALALASDPVELRAASTHSTLLPLNTAAL